MKKVKVGIIGLGGISTVAHMPGYLEMDNVEIAAICDINPEKIDSSKKSLILAKFRHLRITRSF